MARQPRAPRTPHRTGPSQPHGPQRPRGPTAPAMGLGRRAVDGVKAGGNVFKEVFFRLADFLAKLLRRIFGKVTSMDLEQQREEKRAAVNREKEDLENLRNEKADLERDLKRERDSQGERTQDQKRDPHADLLDEAERIREENRSSERKSDPNYSVKPAGPFWETKTLPAGAGIAGAVPSATGMAGSASESVGKDGEWFKGLEAVAAGKLAIGDLARFELLEKLHGGDPYSHASMAAAVERIREVQASEDVEQGGRGMFDMLTCAGYLEAGMENARVKLQGEQVPEFVEGDVEIHIRRIMDEVMSHGSTPEEWTSALAARASLSAQEMEKMMQPSTGKAIGHDRKDDSPAEDGPASGRRPGLPGPSSPSF